ncbi:MAG: glycosyltransferase family 39 protein [Planctomycetota bacterium]
MIEDTTNAASGAGHRIDRWMLTGLLVVTVLALMLRLHRLGAESLWMDEARQVSYYELPLQQVVFQACRHGQPPLDYLIGAGLHRLGLAGSDWWVRLPAAMFGAGCVFLLGWFGCRIAGGVVGITAATLLAFSPLHVLMSQEARPYTIFSFFALATLLLYSRARRRHGFRSWCAFGTAFFAMLMTRGMAPHVLALCIVILTVCLQVIRRRSPEQQERRHEARVFWAVATVVAIAYAIFNPLLGVIYTINKSYAQASPIPWLDRVGRMLTESFSAILAGRPIEVAAGGFGGRMFQAGVAVLAVTGIALLIKRALQDPRSAVVPAVGTRARRPCQSEFGTYSKKFRRRATTSGLVFVGILVPFPLLFAAVYTTATGFEPKPQYLLLMAAPVFMGVAAAAEAIRRRIRTANPVAAWLVFAGLVCTVAVPMGRASVASLYSLDKPGWRDALTFLRERAAAGDAIASVRPHGFPGSMGAYVVGEDRYFGRDGRFLRIECDTQATVLEELPWSSCDNTVWILCNKAHRGREVLSAPLCPTRTIRCHDFHGLFVLESPSGGPAVDRLMDGLALLNRTLPDHRGLIAPNLLRARYHRAMGDHDKAAACIAAAQSQCRTETEMLALTGQLPPLEATQACAAGEPLD